MSETPTAIQHLTEGGVAADHIVLPAPQGLVAPTQVDKEHNTIKTALVPFACWRADDMRFEFESSFVLPEIAKEIEALKDLIDRHTLPNAKGDPEHKPSLSVFGHADPTGSDDFNKALSGRRAQAMYGMLIRKTELWEDLYSHPLGNDTWEPKAIHTMQTTLGQPISDRPSASLRKLLFRAYMDRVCTIRDENDKPVLDAAGQPVQLLLKPGDFLAAGADAGGKGDFQGCGEFNPILLFSAKEDKDFTDPKRKETRDKENAPNRRVVIYLFRPGVRADPASWPCPRAKEGVAGCRKRFWSDGEQRRNTHQPDDRREFAKTKDTFACRFYDRLANVSPCEQVRSGDGLFHMQCLSGDGSLVLAKRKYAIRGKTSPAIQFKGVLDETGTLRHERVPPGDYVLAVQGCGEDTPIAVLRQDEKVAQLRLLENGRLAIHVLTPEGDPILNAVVAVAGVGQRLTDEDGLAYFNTVQDGEFTFAVSKPPLTPVKTVDPDRFRLVGAVAAAPGGTVGDSGGGGTASGKATVKDARTDVVVTLAAKQQPKVSKLVRIEARQAGTLSLRSPTIDFLPANTLPQSQSTETDLEKNKPVVIVRGSRPVFLKAITDPPGELVTWEVTPNQSPGPAPDIDPKTTVDDFEAQVATDKTGSFSVTAKLGTSVLIWNLVLVGVEVDQTSKFNERTENLMDLNEFAQTPEGKKVLTQSGGALPNPVLLTGVASGLFTFGKHAFASEVKVTLKGGGPAGTLGCDQVVVQVLQNLVDENTRGLYKTKIAFSELRLPLLDTAQGSPPGYDGPTVGGGVSNGKPVLQCPFLHSDGMFKLTKNDPTARTMLIGDSPGVGFDTRTKAAGEKLERIDRETRFRTVVVSFSKHSKNAVVAHADLFWQVDWTGNVTVDSGSGQWSKDTAQVKVTQSWKPIKSSSGVEGTDAQNALLELFKPLANEVTSDPKKFIDRP